MYVIRYNSLGRGVSCFLIVVRIRAPSVSSMLKSCLSMRFIVVLKLWPARLCKCKVRGFSPWERPKIAFIDDIGIEIILILCSICSQHLGLGMLLCNCEEDVIFRQ